MRQWSREEIETGLRQGRTLVVQRKDDPNIPIVNALISEGIAEAEIVQLDEQSSVMKVRLAHGTAEA